MESNSGRRKLVGSKFDSPYFHSYFISLITKMFHRKLNLTYDERVTFAFFPNLVLIIARNIDAKFEE